MRRNKIIDISFLLRTVVLTAMLCLSFHIGAFSHIAPDHSIHFVPARNLLISTFLFVLVAQTSVNSLVLQVWNKITPVKSKSTLIETEIVYILSVLLGIPLSRLYFFIRQFRIYPYCSPSYFLLHCLVHSVLIYFNA